RQAMIEGMVGQLQDRLSREGGSVEDWAKLINALGVLGRKDDAQAAYDSAKAAFAGKDADLANLASAAEAAGLTQ
ncbi:MAG: c-type cytochrome biogenesis protein CcmI, partial [Paracoccaceae bacterium]